MLVRSYLQHLPPKRGRGDFPAFHIDTARIAQVKPSLGRFRTFVLDPKSRWRCPVLAHSCFSCSGTSSRLQPLPQGLFVSEHPLLEPSLQYVMSSEPKPIGLDPGDRDEMGI